MATESNAESNGDGKAAPSASARDAAIVGQDAGACHEASASHAAIASHDISASRAASGSVNANNAAENSPPANRPRATTAPATERMSDSDGRQPEIDSRWSGWRGWLLGEIPSAILVFAVRGYQVLLGPFLGGHCRFQPTCSHYFIGAVKKHGPWLGAWRGTLRVLRCHPFRPGGYDPP